MKSKVYFIPVKDSENNLSACVELKRLLEKSRVLDVVGKENKVAVKIHFGEKGNTGFVRPEFARLVCDSITAKGAIPYLTDTNTLYRGRRTNSKDHIEMAREHGFTKDSTGARIIIPDDSKKDDTIEVKIKGKAIRSAKVARFFIDADAIIAVSHFKGHILTGFGGALKNIGMGCAMREGKLTQHCDASPVFYEEKCKGCGACEAICPAGAIHVENGKASLDKSKCIGCAECIAACPAAAMFIDFGVGSAVQEKMVEYAAAVLRGKRGRLGFLNFAVRIHQECDCWGEETPRIAPDIGIFASNDPVAIDKASFDLIKEVCRKDVFKEAHPGQDGMIQLKYAESLGLGSLDYDLVSL
ncbi:MAG: DUF362 domain-containing protein [Candidatus Omnitrophica bacterium]|nr:DUF362 domain-containing protein [Candidatus Omnitrophota bacterium]